MTPKARDWMSSKLFWTPAWLLKLAKDAVGVDEVQRDLAKRCSRQAVAALEQELRSNLKNANAQEFLVLIQALLGRRGIDCDIRLFASTGQKHDGIEILKPVFASVASDRSQEKVPVHFVLRSGRHSVQYDRVINMPGVGKTEGLTGFEVKAWIQVEEADAPKSDEGGNDEAGDAKAAPAGPVQKSTSSAAAFAEEKAKTAAAETAAAKPAAAKTAAAER